jgi:hypothetical protein
MKREKFRVFYLLKAVLSKKAKVAATKTPCF